MRQIDEQRADLKAVLDRAESWLRELELGPGLSYGPRTLQEDLAAIKQLRTRAGSALINVAMFGSSSSGKSFLASGLLHGLKFLRVDSVDGIPSDKYIGLLPFATTPVNTCPARIIPA